MNKIKYYLLSLVLLVSGCSVAPLEQEEKEQKDFVTEYTPTFSDSTHTATVHRLEEFYSNDVVDINYLESIYKGKRKNSFMRSSGQRTDSDLKLHWTVARDLALTEFEFQQEELGWNSYNISDRPRLVLDPDNRAFHRYYEFLILDNDFIKGSILIPTYKQTEYYYTSEVRIYESDGITHTKVVSQWGDFIASQVPTIRVKPNSIVDSYFNDIYDMVLELHNITEFDLLQRSLVEQVSNEDITPVNKSYLSNTIRKITQEKFSNNIVTNTVDPEIESYKSGGGNSTGSQSGTTHYRYNWQEADEQIAEAKANAIIKERDLIKEAYDDYFVTIESDINDNLPSYTATNVYDSIKDSARSEFLKQVKVAYGKSSELWLKDIFTKMSHGVPDGEIEIAESLSVKFWEALDKELSTSYTRGPILTGIGIGAGLGVLVEFSSQLISGTDINDINIEDLKGSAIAGGVIGGFFPPIVVGATIKIALKIVLPNLAKDVSVSVLAKSIDKYLGVEPFGGIFTSFIGLFNKNTVAAEKVFSFIINAFFVAYDTLQESLGKQAQYTLEKQEIQDTVLHDRNPNPPPLPSIDGGDGGSGGNGNGPSWNCPNGAQQPNCNHVGGGQYGKSGFMEVIE